MNLKQRIVYGLGAVLAIGLLAIFALFVGAVLTVLEFL